MDLGTVAVIALIAGLVGGAVGAALVGTVGGMLRAARPDRSWSFRSASIAAAPRVYNAAPFDDFNDRATRILALAQDEAQRFNHPYIGPEHLLLGLARDGESVAGQALKALGATLSKLRSAVESTVGRGEATVAPETISLSAPTKTAISDAREEAHKVGHQQVGPEHLLLGLVRTGGMAMSLFRSLDIDPERVRREVIAALGREGPSGPLERLDADSRNVLALARQEATRSGHEYIGSENLAMALRLCSTLPVGRVWSELAIEPEALRRRIEAVVPPTPGTLPTSGTFTARVTRIFAMAQAVAAERKRDQVSPEHLLIALADEGGGAGAQVLASLGATPQRIREIVDGTKQ